MVIELVLRMFFGMRRYFGLTIAVLVEKQESLLEFGNLFVGELRGSSGIGHLPMLVLLLSVLFSTSSSARGLCFFFHESGLPSRLLFLRCAFSVCVCVRA